MRLRLRVGTSDIGDDRVALALVRRAPARGEARERESDHQAAGPLTLRDVRGAIGYALGRRGGDPRGGGHQLCTTIWRHASSNAAAAPRSSLSRVARHTK